MTFTKLLITACLAAAQVSFAQQPSIGSAALTNRQSILNDRAYFMFPQSAENNMRGTDLMSAGPNANAETRILFDIQDMRLVFFAQEVYSTCSGNLLDITVKDDRDDFKSKLLTDADSMLSVLSTPLSFDSTKAVILVNTLLVKTADNSLFRISAYIAPAAFRKKEEFVTLSERVFSTLSKGSRKLNSKARTEIWPIYEGEKKFSITVPDGYVITKDAKYDFEVLKFNKLTDISDKSFVNLIIYTGHHPSYVYPQRKFTMAQAETVKGSFLGKKTEWLSFRDDEHQFYIREQQIPFDKLGKGTILHVAMLGNSPEAIAELNTIVEQMSLLK